MSLFSSTYTVEGVPCVTARPDSEEILNNKRANSHFSRYFQILRKEAVPKFRIAQTIPVSYNKEKSEDILWRKHKSKMERMKNLFEDNSEKTLQERLEAPSYPEKNLLSLKRELAYKLLEHCRFCERRCDVNRRKGEKGECELEEQAQISTIFTHIGEEAELVPSLTIFFSHCNFHCVFCQNFDISQRGNGETIPPKQVAKGIDSRWRKREVRNVNWVGGEPTPQLHYVLEVLAQVNSNIPQVWNSNLYCSMETLKLLEGVIDLWLPDFKYGNNECGRRLSKVPNYFDVVSRNHRWLSARSEEILIRHLVLPNHLDCCSKPVLKEIAENLNNENIRVNIMDQYRPCWKANKYEEISRTLKRREWKEIVKFARDLGLNLSI